MAWSLNFDHVVSEVSFDVNLKLIYNLTVGKSVTQHSAPHTHPPNVS